MAAPTVSEFRSRYPVFAETSYPDSRVEIAISDALCEISETVWGSFFARGCCALAAHLLKCGDASTTGGAAILPVQSTSIGDVSVSFAGTPVTASAVSGTVYGAEFKRLQSLVCKGPRVV